MKGKTLIANILSFVILAIGAYSGLFSPLWAAWLSVLSYLITLVLQLPVFTSGSMTTGVSFAQYAVLILGIVIQVLNAIGQKALLDPMITNYIVIGITLFIQVFLKEYGTGTSVLPSPTKNTV